MNTQSFTQAGKKYVSLQIGPILLLFCNVPRSKSKRRNLLSPADKGSFWFLNKQRHFILFFSVTNNFSVEFIPILSAPRVRLELLKRNPKFLENHTKIIRFIWSQEGEGKETAEVCPNRTLENQGVFVEIAFPSGYYALRMGEKAKEKY